MTHIFERFYKREKSSSDSVGIGLALAKMIVENDNRRITVEYVPDEAPMFKIKYFFKLMI